MEKQIDDRPLMVSIRCLVYNHEPYLRQCLDGFVMQKTNFRFEAIVHDDASTDNSAAIIREYAEKYPDIIKPIIETENQYSKHDGSLRRIMDEACKGKYIACCEGDDYWTDPLKLQKQVDYLEAHPECGLVYTNFSILENRSGTINESVLGKSYRSIYESVGEWIKYASYVGPMTWLMRRDVYQHPPTIPTVDGSFTLFAHFLANSKVYCLINDNTATYRVLTESASHSKDLSKQYKYKKGVHDAQIKMIEYYSDKIAEPNQLINNINNRYYRRFLFHIIAYGDSIELKNSLSYSSDSWPFLKKCAARCATIVPLSFLVKKIVMLYLIKFNKIV